MLIFKERIVLPSSSFISGKVQIADGERYTLIVLMYLVGGGDF